MTPTTLFQHLCARIGAGEVPVPDSGSLGNSYFVFWWANAEADESWQVRSFGGPAVFQHLSSPPREVIIESLPDLDELLKEISQT